MSMHDDQAEVIGYGLAALAFCLSAIWLRVKYITSADDMPANVSLDAETSSGPYRTSAPNPQQYIEPIKIKREYHMNEKFLKFIKIFGSGTCLLIDSVLVGAVYDTSWGTGLKLGIEMGLMPLGLAFVIAGISAAFNEW